MKTKKIINFDMDGTIADLYGVNGWLGLLQHESPIPYMVAKPLVNMSSLARTLNRLKVKGYEINIISWGAKYSSEEFLEMTTFAKKQWLNQHLKSVQFDNIEIVPYGTPKQEIFEGILFDDEEANREAWGEGAYGVDDIMNTLRKIEKGVDL